MDNYILDFKIEQVDTKVIQDLPDYNILINEFSKNQSISIFQMDGVMHQAAKEQLLKIEI